MLSNYAKTYIKRTASKSVVKRATVFIQQEYGYATAAISPTTSNPNYTQFFFASDRTKPKTPSFNLFNETINAKLHVASLAPNPDAILGETNRNFSALSPDVVELIREEFEAVDVARNGKIDSDELKLLLRRHKNVFTEAEILEISELYYVGNSGKAIPFDTLLTAIDNTLVSSKKNVLGVGSCAAEYYYDVNHHQWNKDQLDIKLTHVEPKNLGDRIAYQAVKLVRTGFDFVTGWNNEITVNKVLQRVIFLETIAAVPGMTAAIIRHFQSLRNMTRDGGLINMFLEEATNERMHLLTFVTLRDPSLAFRASVIGSQFAFGSGFLLAYLVSPNFCHRFVGYVEEEACSTYTKIIEALEAAPEGSELAEWRIQPAPKIGISYWHLGEKGTILDLMYAVRADEAEHRDVNHFVVSMKPGDVNPRFDPSLRLDDALRVYVRDMMKQAEPSTQAQ